MQIRKDFLLLQEGISTRRNWLIFNLFPVCLFAAYLNVKILNAPFQGLLMSGEEHVEPVSFDGAASVENLYRLAVAIAGNDHFSAERVSSVCRHKGITGLYLVSTGCYSI